MAEARAPSTRRLYALKWSIFSAWCQDRDLDPVKQCSSSTIKVYAATIAPFHAPIASRSVGRDSAVIQFLSQENKSPACSYSSTLGITNRTKVPKRAPVWTIAILEPQSTLVENRPAVSIGAGWSSPSTFVRFYNLDVHTLQAKVLSAWIAIFQVHLTNIVQPPPQPLFCLVCP